MENVAFRFQSYLGNWPSVDYPVGMGGTNRRDDVMLVQSLLNGRLSLYQVQKTSNVDYRTAYMFQHGLKVDGKWGVKSQRAWDALRRINGNHAGHLVMPVYGRDTKQGKFAVMSHAWANLVNDVPSQLGLDHNTYSGYGDVEEVVAALKIVRTQAGYYLHRGRGHHVKSATSAPHGTAHSKKHVHKPMLIDI
jgi:hypothetical protein